MSFIAPVFLGGLILVSVPIAIHLLTRMRRRTIPLPTFKFLLDADRTTRTSRRLRDLLILLLRVATVILLVIAFARPSTLDSLQAGTREGSSSKLTILIDRSASMSHMKTSADKSDRKTLLDTAREESLRLIRSADPGTHFMIIAYDEAPELLIQDAQAEAAENAVTSIKKTFKGTDASAVLKLVSEYQDPGIVILISDMAKNSFRGMEKEEIDELGFELRFIDLSFQERWNRWISGVNLPPAHSNRPADVTRGKYNVDVDVHMTRGAPETFLWHTRTAKAPRIPVTLGNISQGSIEYPLPDKKYTGAVRLEADMLPVDDIRYISVKPSEQIKTGYIADDRASTYLKAIRYGSEWSLVRKPEDINHLDALVITGGEMSPGITDAVEAFVRRGGTLIVFATAVDRLSRSSGIMESSNEKLFNKILPVIPGRRIENEAGVRLEVTHRLAQNKLGWKLFEGIEAETRRAPISFIRLNVSLKPEAKIVSRLEDGAPYLVTRQLDRGSVIFWNTSADATWSDLPVHSLYPVMFVRLIGGTQAESSDGLRVGDNLIFPATFEDNKKVAGIGPNGKKIKGIVKNGIARFGIADRPGIYRFGKEVAVVNIDPEEGDITPVSVSELSAGRAGTPRVETVGGDITSLLDEVPKDPQGLWRWLILAAIIIGFTEVLIGKPTGTAPLVASKKPRASTNTKAKAA